MPLSLVDLGRNTFGIVGSVTLSDLYTSPYTRAVPPYRVNPFSVANGNGPADFSAPYPMVADWENYGHGALNIGDNVRAIIGYGGEFTLEWDAPVGFQADVCRYRVSIKDTGTSPDETVDPLVSPTSQVFTTSLSQLFTALSVDHWYACAVEVEFDDGSTAILSNGFPGHIDETELTGDTQGILTSEPLPPNAPEMGAVTQSPDAEFCDDPINDGLTVTCNYTMQGPSQGTIEYQINSDGWVTWITSVPAGDSSSSLSASEGGYGNGDTVHFRLRYNDVSPTVWSDTGSLQVFCGPL